MHAPRTCEQTPPQVVDDTDAKAEATQLRKEELAAKAKTLSFAEKLYQISLERPDIWRKMKQVELEKARREEFSRAMGPPKR